MRYVIINSFKIAIFKYKIKIEKCFFVKRNYYFCKRKNKNLHYYFRTILHLYSLHEFLLFSLILKS